MRKCHFELSRGETWSDFEYPIAIRRFGQVVGWAAEHAEASLLVYTANTRKDGSRYLPPNLSVAPEISVDASARQGAVGDCKTALTCDGRVVAWMKHPRHARFLAGALKQAAVA